MHFYTSININYLAKARVLAKSVKEHCKNSTFTLVFADKIPDDFDIDREPFDNILTVDQLGIPVPNLQLWIFMHTVVELCTAIKGPALVKFLNEGFEKVVYLDPDIAVFDSLSEIEELLDNYDVILTPHQTLPELNEKDIINNEICSLKYGTYNYGFYAVRNSENGIKYANWWSDRLVRFCYDDIPNGLFTDQRWGDLAPAMFDGVYILRDPGYNVSTWNITTRMVTRENGKYKVNGRPLRFYHFSGFDSGAQEIMLNENGQGNPCLYELRQWYIERQREEEQEKYFNCQSIYNYYDNGVLISKEQRKLMRSRMDLVQYFGEVNPFVTEQDRSYYKWYLNEQNLLKKKMSDSNLLLNEEKDCLVKRILELENEINKIYSSRSWKVANAIKRAANFLLRRN